MTQGPLGSILWVCPAWHLYVDDETCKDTQRGKAAAVELARSELTTWPPGLRRERLGEVMVCPGHGAGVTESRRWEFDRMIPLVTTIHVHCSHSLLTFLEVFFLQ